MVLCLFHIFFFKQKTAYEMRISDWSSDVCSSDLYAPAKALRSLLEGGAEARPDNARLYVTSNRRHLVDRDMKEQDSAINVRDVVDDKLALSDRFGLSLGFHNGDQETYLAMVRTYAAVAGVRSEEHTSELQSLMRISYAVFCLKKKTHKYNKQNKKTTNHSLHINSL